VTKPSPHAGLPGREDVVDEVLASIMTAEGHGSLIVADDGMGKTSVAAAVLALAGERVRPFHAFASPVLAQEPYGALAPFLIGLPDGGTSSPSLVLGELAAALELEAPETAVLVIDDAQFLDDSSAVVLAQLAAANEAKFIFLCAPFPVAPPELWSMCSYGLLKSFELQALPPAVMAELCTRALGAPLLPSASAALCRRAAGNPMFLLELIKHARDTGALVERSGVWLLVHEPAGSTVRARNVVRNQLFQLSKPERQTLEYVAVAGSIGMGELHELADSATVDALEEAKLIVVSPVPSQMVTLAVPPMGELICELLPVAGKLALRRKLLTMSEWTHARDENLIRYVDWSLAAGRPVDDGDALRAAQLANGICLPDLAERSAAAVTAPDLLDAARFEMARTLIWRGDLAALAALVQETLEGSRDIEAVRRMAGLAGHVGLQPGVDDEAITMTATGWRAAVDRLLRDGAPQDEAVLAEHRTSVRLLEIQGMHAAGNYQGTESELTDIYRGTGNSPINRLVSCTLLSELLTATGRAYRGRDLAAEAFGIIGQTNGELVHFYEFVLRRSLGALGHAGAFGEIRAAVDQALEEETGRLLAFGGTYQLAQGLGELGRGAMNAALQSLGQAVEALSASDPGNDLPLGLAAAAYAAAVLGRETVSEQYAQRFEADGAVRDVASKLRARAFLLAAHGMFEGNPRPHLRRAADEAAALGMVHVEMDVLTMGIHAGDLGLALRLKAVALRCEGLSGEHAAAYAKALAEKDPMALLAFSEEAEQDGRELAAARSAANAVAILNRRGDRNRLHGAQRLAKRRLARLIYGNSPLSDRLGTVQQLTRRERKVAAMVHAGASNRDVATAFGLSLRTVEGHLYRIFAKLGISDRSEIANTAPESWQV